MSVTHPHKVLWPGEGITKLELAEYDAAFAPLILRYAAERPLTFRLFPRGVNQPGVYRKEIPPSAPAWVETFVDVAQSTGAPVHFVVARDARTLVWMAQMNAVEVHPWLSRVDQPDTPDWAVMDVDPFDDTPWSSVAQAALAVRAVLAERGVPCGVKLSGQSGVHVLVRLAPGQTFSTVRAFFQHVAAAVCRQHPDLVTTDYRTDERRGRILLDYAQNARGKSTAAPYSVRPRPGAPVSAPVTWGEVEQDASLRPNRWTLRTISSRLDDVGDLLEPISAEPVRLP